MTKSWTRVSKAFGVALILGAVPTYAKDAKQTTAEGIRGFGFQLFQSIYNEKGKEPVAISPMSIAEALTMATQGADKETKEELEKIFGAKADAATLAEGVKALREALVDYSKKSDGVFEYTSANALWGNTNPDWDFKFQPDFLKKASDNYGAKLVEEDFLAPGTVKNINDWVDQNTNGKIKELVSKLDKNMVAVLLNAIYAKGKFQNHFHQVSEGSYTNAQGKKVPASFLTQKSHFNVYEAKDIKAFSVAIGDQNYRSKAPRDQIALDILVSTDGKLDTLVKGLTDAKYASIVKAMKPKEIELSIVAGKVEQQAPISLVKALGAKPFEVERAFSEERAQFSSMGETRAKQSNLYVSDIITKTFYEVTPFGFEAAAATAVLIAAATAVPAPPPVVKITGPSVHVVRHVPTGTPLFISVYDSPQLYDEARIIDLLIEGEKAGRYLNVSTKDGQIYVQNDFNTGKKQIVLVDKDGNVKKVLKTL